MKGYCSKCRTVTNTLRVSCVRCGTVLRGA